MKRYARLLTSFYVWLLVLYPRRYRREYGDELRSVFGRAAEEAAEDGPISLLRFCLHELRDLPPAALRQHMKEKRRSKAVDDTGELLVFKSASWREISLAAAPFLYFGLIFYSLTNGLLADGPRWIYDGATFGMLALVVALFLAGLFKGLPRWSLPTMGLIFAILLILILTQWSASFPIFIRIKPWHPVWLRQLIYQFRMKADLLRVAIIILVSVAALTRFTPFFDHLKRDWTRLSFTLYGTALLGLAFTFDDYQKEEPYVLAASVFLAAGAFVYLKCGRSWQRLWALFTGLTLAMAVTALGKAILFSRPDWPWPRNLFTWQSEVMNTIYFWVFLLLVIFVPAFFLRLVLFSRKRLSYR
jgi:hypothetical protein